jgi:DNA repair exonuclease SbcCD nuclease subunit
MNDYGWDILVEQRMPAIHKALLSYQANRPWPIEELQIWMLGDMCSGSNHEEIIETNELTAAEQAYQVGILLGKFVEELIPHYPSIKVYGVVGNHPRVTKAPQAKNTYNNFDWVAYKYCETYLSKYDVPCYFDEPSLTVAEIAGLNYLLFHGDGIRSSMPGVPWGGVTRRVNALKGQYADFGVHLDGYALGHFHDPNAVRDILMNGAVKGVDEWVLKQFGTAAPPTQLLATFNIDKGRRTDVSYINP